MTDEEFAQTIARAIERHGVATLAGVLKTSHPTIKRWGAGLNAPVRCARAPIIEALRAFEVPPER